MNLVAELERLMAERAEHVTKIARIDEELERARLALIGASAQIPTIRSRRQPPPRQRRERGFWTEAILTALAEREPPSGP